MTAAILPPPMGGLTAAAGAGGGDDGGDQPSRNHLKPTHVVDAAPDISDLDANPDAEAANLAAETNSEYPTPSPPPPSSRKRRKPPTFPDDAPLDCRVCGKMFKSPKAVHGHMRCHPDRDWRGVAPPWERRAREAILTGEAAEGRRFHCSGCTRVFGTRQALGGHRASHKKVKGCYALNKDGGVEGEGEGSGVKTGPRNENSYKQGGEVGTRRGGRYSLDLNLPPPPDQDQDEDLETPEKFDLNAEGSKKSGDEQ